MQGKIYLHVGTHKTGTTSLQDSLARHRAHLNALGVLYPRLQPYFAQRTTGHHAFAHALASYNLRDRMKLWGLRRTIDAQMRGKRFGILSAEALYRHTVGLKPHASVDAWFDAHKRYLDRVATYLEGYDVQPVIYFRRPEDFIVSLYKEGVAIRNEALFTSLKEFIELRLPRLDYQRHVAVL